MPKPKTKSTKRSLRARPKGDSRARSKGLGSLGMPPDAHRSREEGFARQAKDKIAAMNAALREKKCSVAFAKLIDGVSYSGMAEAEAAGSGKKSASYASDAVSAMRAFRDVCKIGE